MNIVWDSIKSSFSVLPLISSSVTLTRSVLPPFLPLVARSLESSNFSFANSKYPSTGGFNLLVCLPLNA
ncbi:MAG: hypothetical protein IKJ19_04075 [Clostridia bacterium]|nr:hypothetical protein [Clostridia bacterium]